MLVVSGLVLVVSLVLVWLARYSPAICFLGYPGGCTPDPKLLPAVVSTFVIPLVFLVFVLLSTGARAGRHRGLGKFAFVLLAVLALAGPTWTYVTGGF